MNAFEIMSKHAPLVHATHIEFDQQWLLPHLPEKNKRGVCAALCLRWLKSSHKRGYLIHRDKGVAHNQEAIAFISQLQSDLSTNKYDQSYINKITKDTRGGGGFGSLSLTIIDKPFVASTVLGGHGQRYDLKTVTANIMWGAHQNCGATLEMGFGDVAAQMPLEMSRNEGQHNISETNSGEVQHKINPGDSEEQENHVVAAYKGVNEFMFFDPNGGVLIFKEANTFYDWFHKHFFDADNYKKYRWGEFVYYQIG